MKNAISICLLLFSANTFANTEVEKVMAEYYVKSDEVDSKLTAKQANYKFEVGNVDVVMKTMRISVNGVWRTVDVKEHKFEVTVQPGSYKFQFLLGKDYYEIKTENIDIEAKHVKTIVLNFRFSQREVMDEKPVIYVYSEQEKEVTVTLQPKGSLTFTYPPTAGSWTGKITKAGFEINHITYPYLFWEATQTMDLANLDWSSSSILSNAELLKYLEEATAKIGMNSTEKTDFITYWGPRMMKYENLEVQFVTENVNDLLGDLSVSDPSFKVQRIYLLFRETESQESKIDLDGITPIIRSGNLVFEWGGSEIPALNN